MVWCVGLRLPLCVPFQTGAADVPTCARNPASTAASARLNTCVGSGGCWTPTLQQDLASQAAQAATHVHIGIGIGRGGAGAVAAGHQCDALSAAARRRSARAREPVERVALDLAVWILTSPTRPPSLPSPPSVSHTPTDGVSLSQFFVTFRFLTNDDMSGQI